MKKLLVYSLLLISLVFLPSNVFAKSYDLKDINVTVDDSTWYVFTRDNLENNAELAELGITPEYLKNVMTTNDIYLDACLFDTNEPANTVELFVVIKKVDDVSNLHTYSDSEIEELGEALKKKVNADDYNIYTVDKYKYVHVKYYDPTTTYNIDEYYTVINGYGYTIMAQKTNQFSSLELTNVKNVVDTAKFKYNSSYEKPPASSKGGINIWQRTLIGAITGGVIGGLSVLFNKKKKKDKNAVNVNPTPSPTSTVTYQNNTEGIQNATEETPNDNKEEMASGFQNNTKEETVPGFQNDTEYDPVPETKNQ